MLTNFLKKLWIKPEDQSTLQDNLYFLDKMDWSLVKKTNIFGLHQGNNNTALSGVALCCLFYKNVFGQEKNKLDSRLPRRLENTGVFDYSNKTLKIKGIAKTPANI